MLFVFRYVLVLLNLVGENVTTVSAYVGEGSTDLANDSRLGFQLWPSGSPDLKLHLCSFNNRRVCVHSELFLSSKFRLKHYWGVKQEMVVNIQIKRLRDR